MARLSRKFDMAKTLVPKPVIDTMDGANIGIIAFGSTEPAIQEARHHLAQSGLKTDFLRLRAVPFTEEITEFINSHQRSYVIEMNRDGQLHQLLTLEYASICAKLTSVAHLDGLSMTAHWVEDRIMQEENKK
jgi:2-oxoglutarate ferredoxin oxidoreductase subunit alpha